VSDGASRAVLLVVRGRVQGVGYRWFACREARALGLVGRVRNLRDGTVEVAAAGPDEALAALRDRLREGPSGAQVEALDECEPPELSERAAGWDRFEIDR
jgi:acylphosphatase